MSLQVWLTFLTFPMEFDKKHFSCILFDVLSGFSIVSFLSLYELRITIETGLKCKTVFASSQWKMSKGLIALPCESLTKIPQLIDTMFSWTLLLYLYPTPLISHFCLYTSLGLTDLLSSLWTITNTMSILNIHSRRIPRWRRIR